MNNPGTILAYSFSILAITLAGMLSVFADDPAITTTYSTVFTQWQGHIYYTVTDANGVDHPHQYDCTFLDNKATALAKCINDETDMQNQGYSIKGPITIHLEGPIKDKPSGKQIARNRLNAWGPWVAIQCLKDKGFNVQYRLMQVSAGFFEVQFRNQSGSALNIEYYLLPTNIDKSHLLQYFDTSVSTWQCVRLVPNGQWIGSRSLDDPTFPPISYHVNPSNGNPQLYINSVQSFEGSPASPQNTSDILSDNDPDTGWGESPYDTGQVGDDAAPSDGITR
jgi:hypothetical protein